MMRVRCLSYLMAHDLGWVSERRCHRCPWGGGCLGGCQAGGQRALFPAEGRSSDLQSGSDCEEHPEWQERCQHSLWVLVLWSSGSDEDGCLRTQVSWGPGWASPFPPLAFSRCQLSFSRRAEGGRSAVRPHRARPAAGPGSPVSPRPGRAQSVERKAGWSPNGPFSSHAPSPAVPRRRRGRRDLLLRVPLL